MALLAAQHLPGIIVEPIVIFDLPRIVEFGADEDHPAARALNDLPRVPLENGLAVDRVANGQGRKTKEEGRAMPLGAGLKSTPDFTVAILAWRQSASMYDGC